MRYEVSQEPKDVEPGDIAVMRLVTTKGAVKWTCGTVRCFTDDDEDPAIVLTTGKILLVPLCAVLLVVALSWRLWLIALGFAVAAAAVVWLETEEGADCERD